VARDARSARASGWWGANRLAFTQACRVDFDRQIKHPRKSHQTSARNKHAEADWRFSLIHNGCFFHFWGSFTQNLIRGRLASPSLEASQVVYSIGV